MRALTLLAAPVLAASLAAPALAASGALVDKTATLPDIPLGAHQSLADDRDALLGGVGSGLFPVSKNEYWMITDRGPNGEIGDTRTFPVPDFTPTLVHVLVRGEHLQVLEAIPITTPDGAPVTGLPSFPKTGDPAPTEGDGVTPLAYNPNGLDTEGVVRAADGSFWVVDEYGPSIVHVGADGRVIARFVPGGTSASYDGAAYPIHDTLPAGLANRRANRGFEDIALLPDGRTVVVALQSAPSKSSLVTELVSFDTVEGIALHEFAYEFDAASTFKKAKTGDLKISALIPVDQTHVVVQERTDDESRFYTVALDPADALISGADKSLLVDLAGVEGVPGKIEGAALKTRDTLVIVNDNDFGFDTARSYAPGEPLALNGVTSRLLEIKLP